MSAPTRRDVLKQLGAASASLALSNGVIRGQGSDIVVAGQPVEVVVSSVNPYTARVVIRQVSGGSDANLNDGALVKTEWGAPLARLAGVASLSTAAAGSRAPGSELATRIALRNDQLVLTFHSAIDPARGTLRSGLWQELSVDRTAGAVTFRAEGGPWLGFGEGGRQFDRHGGVDRMRSGQVTDQQSGYGLRTNGGRVPIQWLINASGGGALYIHQPLGTFDLTTSEGRFTPPAAAPLPIDLFVVATNDPLAIMKAWADITGLPEMPPLWSFGYLQSHRTLAGPAEILKIADTFREKKLPCDGLIYLGTDFCPAGWNTHNGEFTWNPATFPEPKKQIDELHARHFKVVLHTVIEGQHLTGSVTDACAAPEPSGRTPDNRWPADRVAGCYWPHHKAVSDAGVDGWWPDQGDGYDPASKLNRIRMYWEGGQQLRPNERVFALHRNGCAGMQRYAGFLWSGDVYSLWETLKNHVPIAVNCGLSGIPYWGTDIGGFVPTADYTGELHVRWFQFGAFTTLFRAHGRTWHLRLPWGWNTGDVGVSEVAGYTGGAQDPPESELHNAAVEPIIRKYLELRYRLLPYTYTAVRECTQTGLPIVRAMWLHYPDDEKAVARGDQYLWGRDILVAPVVEKGATSRPLYLPKGAWFDFWTNERLEGGREIDRPVDLATMPLYVRAGAVIPMGPVRQYIDEPTTGPLLTLVAHPGADGASSIYVDDGRTFDYRKGTWMGIDMQWRDAERRVTLALTPGSRVMGVARLNMDVRIAGTQMTRSVTFDGRPVDVRF